jgi:hypothetical protein
MDVVDSWQEIGARIAEARLGSVGESGYGLIAAACGFRGPLVVAVELQHGTW